MVFVARTSLRMTSLIFLRAIVDVPILSDFLRNHFDLCQRIIIPRELKWEVRDKFDQDNVTESMLFPGFDGLSR
jgi:hypothetical protein